MPLNELGEFGLIERIRKLLPANPPHVVEGIGDDVAVLAHPGSDYLLATCDVQVEGVHFLPRFLAPRQLGRRVMAVNLSDLAAAGGAPLWALVSLCLPENTQPAFVEELYGGMLEELHPAEGVIVGGNVAASPCGLVIDVSLLGRVAPEHLVLRKGAREGDRILVTGFPGDSKAGFELLRRPDLLVSSSIRERLVAKHLTPSPRLWQGRALGRSGRVRAMVDVSDGLLADLGHICQASGLGAQVWVEEVPVSDAAREAAGICGGDVVKWALSGGEDFELLFTAGEEDVPCIMELLRERRDVPCRVIGRMTAPHLGMEVIFPDGSRTLADPFAAGSGWDHFRKI